MHFSTEDKIHVTIGSSSLLFGVNDIVSPFNIFFSSIDEKGSSSPSLPDPLEWTRDVEVPNKKFLQPFKESDKLKYYRFDFHGRLLSFEESISISPAKGLHHHGEEPALAGYTIYELLHLARSSFASQAIIRSDFPQDSLNLSPASSFISFVITIIDL